MPGLLARFSPDAPPKSSPFPRESHAIISAECHESPATAVASNGAAREPRKAIVSRTGADGCASGPRYHVDSVANAFAACEELPCHRRLATSAPTRRSASRTCRSSAAGMPHSASSHEPCGTQLGHRRRPADRELCRPAGQLPQHSWQGEIARCLQALLREPVHRSCNPLPPRSRIRSLQSCALDRRHEDGALGSRLEWRHVLARH